MLELLLIARRKRHLDTNVICTVAREKGIEIYNTSTPEALKIVNQLQEDSKELHFGQSEHESTPFTTKTMQQKFDWNTSTEEAKEVLQGTYNSGEDKELTEIMKLLLTNCVQISPPKTNPEITVAQLREEIKV